MIARLFNKSLVSILAFLFGFAAKVAAQYGVIENTFLFKGKVLDAQSLKPIPEAEIHCKTLYAEQRTKADSNGNFSLQTNRMYEDSLHLQAFDNDGMYLEKDSTFIIRKEDFVFDKNYSHWKLNALYNQVLVMLLPSQIIKEKYKRDTILSESILAAADTFLSTTDVAITILENDTSQLLSKTNNYSEIFVFPNPTEDKLYVQINEEVSGEIYLKLFSDELQIVWRKEVNLQDGQHTLQLDVSGFAKGSYFLMVESNRKKWVKKIIKM